jgi:hypothetical protein
MRNVYSILVGKSEEKRPLGRSRYRSEDNIKMDFKDVHQDVDSIHLVECRIQFGSCEQGNKLSGSKKGMKLTEPLFAFQEGLFSIELR